MTSESNITVAGWRTMTESEENNNDSSDDDDGVESKRGLHLPSLLPVFQGISLFDSSSGLLLSSADSKVQRREIFVCELARIAQKS